MSKIPEKNNYTPEDKENYARLMVKTNPLYRDNNPDNNYPKSSKLPKWNNILSPIWANRKKYEASGVIIIPSDPNANGYLKGEGIPPTTILYSNKIYPKTIIHNTTDASIIKIKSVWINDKNKPFLQLWLE